MNDCAVIDAKIEKYKIPRLLIFLILKLKKDLNPAYLNVMKKDEACF